MSTDSQSRSEEAESSQKIEAKLQALKLIKDWSAGLIVVQTGAIAVIGALIETPLSVSSLPLVFAVLASLVTSIYLGAVSVIGTVPYVVQHVPDDPDRDIYDWRGGLRNFKGRLAGMTLGDQCMLQSNLFVVSLILFAIFVVFHSSGLWGNIALVCGLLVSGWLFLPWWFRHRRRSDVSATPESAESSLGDVPRSPTPPPARN